MERILTCEKIPKIIHYIWLSEQKMPYINSKCFKSWQRVLPNYHIKRWRLEDFNLNNMRYVSEAIQAQKWAFATDYLRLYVLYHEGGVYLDTDILAIKSFDRFLEHRFFSFIEYHHDSKFPVIQAAFMGSQKGHPFLKALLSHYENRHFIHEDGSYDTALLAPDVYASKAHLFGFRDIPKEQALSDGIHIYDQRFVAGTPYETDKENVAIHFCAGSWRNLSLKTRLKQKLLFLQLRNKNY